MQNYFLETGEMMSMRGCSLDSGSLTADTELVRISHCGAFYIDQRYIGGNIIFTSFQ